MILTQNNPQRPAQILLDSALDYLQDLVAIDTQNPPRLIKKSGIFDYLGAELDKIGGFERELVDHGEGCMSLFAARGEPKLLFNFHVDTVPASRAWERDPFELLVNEERAVGLGACDIKGASACILAALAQTEGEVALLFTSDEEAGSSRCVKEFLRAYQAGKYPHSFDGVIVAEPTQARAVLEHRGISTGSAVFHGVAGHASERRALADSALHRAVHWAEAALQYAERHERSTYRGLSGIRFNLGVVEGGIKPNIIAPMAKVRFGFRPLPDQDSAALMADIQALGPTLGDTEWLPGFFGPTLPADGDASRARLLADSLHFELGPAVDFWTEASLFSQAGLPAIVYGPGDIAQAHTAGEWVALGQLERVAATYARLLS